VPNSGTSLPCLPAGGQLSAWAWPALRGHGWCVPRVHPCRRQD